MVAQGRVWTGQQAQGIGLVDEMGGLERAIAIAKEHAKIDKDSEVELVLFPPKRSLYESLANPFGAARGGAAIAALLGVTDHRAVQAITAPMRLFRRGEPLAIMPNVFVR